jgi:hypothetical protein
LRDAAESSTDTRLVQKIRAILDRKPLKLIAWYEYLGARADEERFLEQKAIVEARIQSWRDKSDLPYWTLWERPGFTLTSLASTVELPLTAAELSVEELEQSVHILEPGKTRSRPIMKVTTSLMKELSKSGYFALRVYTLIPDESPDKIKRVRDIVKADLLRNWDFIEA